MQHKEAATQNKLGLFYMFSFHVTTHLETDLQLITNKMDAYKTQLLYRIYIDFSMNIPKVKMSEFLL